MAAAGIDATTAGRILAYSQTFGPSSGAPTDLTDALADIIVGVSEQIEQYLGNRLLIAARVYKPTIVRRHARLIRLPHAPVDTGQTVEVREATDRDFSDAGTIVDAENYYLDAVHGSMLFDVPLTGRAGTVQITTTGGLGTDTDDLEAGFPGVVLAATMWAAEIYRRRRTATKVAVGGRGGTGVSYDPMVGMPRQVRDLLMPHRRMMFAR
jgi:hypothetical protein